MNEQQPRSPELTPREAYSTLNKAHSLPSVGSTMPEPTEPQTPRNPRPGGRGPQPRRSEARQPQGERPLETVADVMNQSIENRQAQAEREALRGLMEAMQEEGRIITPQELQARQNRMGARVIAGGADEPENEGYDFNNPHFAISSADIVRPGEEEHPEIRAARERINAKAAFGGIGNLDFNELKREAEHVEGLRSKTGEPPIPSDQKQRIIQMLSRNAQTQIGNRLPDRFGFYLEGDIIKVLDDDPMDWLSSQFDQINEFAKKGSELESPVVQRVQTMVSEASSYMQTKFEKFLREHQNSTDPAVQIEIDENNRILSEFNENFNVRLNLMYGRFAVESGGMEQIQGAAGRLKADGMLGSLSFDKGRVGEMYYRMQGMLEDLRLAEGGKEHHLYPATVNKMQELLIEEQIRMAKQGLGMFADEYIRLGNDPNKPRAQATVDRLLKREVTRSVRTAYDVLVVSQRVAVISSRGDQTEGAQQYYSDVGGAFLKAYNLEASNLVKWGSLNKEEQHFFEFLKLDLAINNKVNLDISGYTREQLLELGTRLFRDLYAVPDFFSGSWRFNGMRNQLIDVTRYKLYNNVLADKLASGNFEEGSSLAGVKGRLQERVQADLAKWETERGGRVTAEEKALQEKKIARQALSETKVMTKDQRFEAIRTLLPDDITGLEARVRELAGTRDWGWKESEGGDEREVADFGLFLQLVQRGRDKSEPVWQKIKKYRSEEIIRLVRERAKGDIRHDDIGQMRSLNGIFTSTDSDLSLDPSEVVYRKDAKGRTTTTPNYEVFGSYDKFKMKYGGIIRALRRQAMDLPTPTQLDMRHLNEAQKRQVDTFTGKAGDGEKLVQIFEKMDDFIGTNNIIGELVHSPKYVDIYARVITMDDAPLEDMQNPAENSGVLALSQQWTGEVGGDGLKRTIGDTASALNASGTFWKLITSEGTDERVKAAVEMKKQVEDYNGRDGGAEVMRFTAGTEYLYALQDYWIDVLGIGALPFRQPTSQKQRDYGIGAHSLTREQIRKQLDHHKTEFVGRGADADKWFKQLEQLTETDLKGKSKQTILALLFYISLGLLVGVPLGASYIAVNESTK